MSLRDQQPIWSRGPTKLRLTLDLESLLKVFQLWQFDQFF